jgi:Alternative oxidase.
MRYYLSFLASSSCFLGLRTSYCKTAVSAFQIDPLTSRTKYSSSVPYPQNRITNNLGRSSFLKSNTFLFSAQDENNQNDASTPTIIQDSTTTTTTSPSNAVDKGPLLYMENSSYSDGTRPANAFVLAVNNFVRQGSSILQEAFAEIGITGKDFIPPSERLPDCLGFTLDSEAVKEAARRRESSQGGKVETNPASRALYDLGCFALDELFENRPIARFWFLEIVARIPYFAYISMLHLYESLGWWRVPELRKVHNAEEYNELHHLLIMEALGGNARWRDRFLDTMVQFYIIGWSLVYFFSLLKRPMNSWNFWSHMRLIHIPRF